MVVPVNMGGELKAPLRPRWTRTDGCTCRSFACMDPARPRRWHAERDELERERHRIWYVAATRARDLLLLPDFSTGVPKNSWMERFGLRHDGLDPFDPSALPAGLMHERGEPPNTQDRPVFEAEAALIASRMQVIERITPHLAESWRRTGRQPHADAAGRRPG